MKYKDKLSITALSEKSLKHIILWPLPERNVMVIGRGSPCGKMFMLFDKHGKSQFDQTVFKFVLIR